MMVLCLVFITQCIIYKHNEIRMQQYTLYPYEYYEKMAKSEELSQAAEELNQVVSEVEETEASAY